MEHIYGAIVHQSDSVFSVEGRNESRLLVYQDRDVKTLNVFYYSQGEHQNQDYMDKLEHMETRWATINPSYVAGGRRQRTLRAGRKEDPWDCFCHVVGSCDLYCHLQKRCGCKCLRECKCHCLTHSQRWCMKCSCHLHTVHCMKVKTYRCHFDVLLERAWINDFT